MNRHYQVFLLKVKIIKYLYLSIYYLSIHLLALCAEISQTVIRNIDEAIQWLQNTFFYLRVKQNPIYYGFSSTLTPEQLNDVLRKLIIKYMNNFNNFNNFHILNV